MLGWENLMDEEDALVSQEPFCHARLSLPND